MYICSIIQQVSGTATVRTTRVWTTVVITVVGSEEREEREEREEGMEGRGHVPKSHTPASPKYQTPC